MLTKTLSMLLMICALLSGQLGAAHNGHEYLRIENADHLLRHNADSDELRAAAEEAADGLREHHFWQRSRRPDTHCG